MLRSYLDHAATSPMPPSVREAYVEALSEVGNPASVHADGQLAGAKLEGARYRVAHALGAEPVEVTFTSGGTESINLALKGTWWAQQTVSSSRNTIMLPATEHHATIDAAEWLRDHEGAHLEWLDVDRDGSLNPATLSQAIERVGSESVALITFLLANNEVGTISDVTALCGIAREHQIPVHVDAVSALGQVPLDLHAFGADLMSVSAHKIGGPVGIGALAISRSTKLEPLMHGGNQQRARSGTQNVAGAVAFQAALDHIGDVTNHASILRLKRDKLIRNILDVVPEAVLRGAEPSNIETRLAGNAHFTFPGCQGDSLLYLLDAQGISVSVGSACQAGVQEISHVLLAMGIPEHEAIGSLRMTLSADTTNEEIDALIRALPDAYAQAKRAGIV